MPTHRLLEGKSVTLKGLKPWELKFLRDLKRLASDGTSYYQVIDFALGSGSPAKHGDDDVFMYERPLYLVSRDIATRVGIKQKVLLSPSQERRLDQVKLEGGMMSVAQAAKLIGISKAAVYKALEKGSLESISIGYLTLVHEASVRAYRQKRNAA